MIDHNYKLIEGWFDHDYGWSSVSKAVNETFTPYKIENNCWFVKISK